jgi:3-phenylpropionate/trans-cinnamate dioxygenase ferredoxin subunit
VTGRGFGVRWIPLAPDRIPAEGELRAVEVSPALRVLVARVAGRLHAIDDVCNHAGCLLSKGKVEGARVICPCHTMAFDLRDGRLLTTPGLAGDQRAFEVVEEDGRAVLVLREA